MSSNVPLRRLSKSDRVIAAAGAALRTFRGGTRAERPYPANAPSGSLVTAPFGSAAVDFDQKASGALMRVNHVGEVCAQALYTAQSLGTSDVALQRQLDAAAREEADHLAWTQQRLDELGDRPSLLNPVWYAGAFAIGWLASRAGTATSLGFVVETERQVERHLQGHLERLSVHDTASRAIVAQMQADEAAHAAAALRSGARELAAPARWAMRVAAKVMTTVAHRI